MNHKSPSSKTQIKWIQIDIGIIILLSLVIVGLGLSFYLSVRWYKQENSELAGMWISSKQNEGLLLGQVGDLEASTASLAAAIEMLESEDQRVVNKKLQSEIEQIESVYKKTVAVYEAMIVLEEKKQNTQAFRDEYSKVIVALANRDYEGAGATLKGLSDEINKKIQELAAASGPTVTASVSSNEPPGSGYQRQRVETSAGSFVVDLIAGDLSSTKVIVDTASENDCSDGCPTLSLDSYVSRNGGFAGINGSYFCPASYPSCAGKTNSFDTLLMNKNKVYFNSDNNVYSTVPAVIFGSGWIRFVGRSLDWGRDTSIDSMIANQPLLVSDKNVVFGGDGDPKKGSRGARSFVANRGNSVYIGVVFNATVAESALALQALGMDNGLNLDSGGSTALWYGGYKVGPGRSIPNAIILVRK